MVLINTYLGRSGLPAETSPGGIYTVFWASKYKTPAREAKLVKDAGETGILRIEDGFIRSQGLGCNFYYPYSLVFDTRGIYYDPRHPSDLEYILLHIKERADYAELMQRTQKLVSRIVSAGVQKYHQGTPARSRNTVRQELSAKSKKPLNDTQKIIFVPGQVDDDASIITGGNGWTSIPLLLEVRKRNPDAFIIFKIHPDVLAGIRNQNQDKLADAENAADIMCTDEWSVLDLIAAADEVDTISSLTGFEALIRGCSVHTFGMPFYAGWGITQDEVINKVRNTVTLNSIELAAGALILYPMYYDWEKRRRSTPEEIIDELLAHPEGSKRNYTLVFLRKTASDQ